MKRWIGACAVVALAFFPRFSLAETSLWTPEETDNVLADASQPQALAPVLPPEFMDVSPLVAGPGTQPATQPLLQPETWTQRSIAEIIGHFSAYQPMYFIAGPVSPLVKFQFSLKYRLFNEKAPLAKVPILGGLTFAYTQLNLFELDKPSAPFYDTNYNPEIFYSNEDIKIIKLPLVSELGLQTGFGHESNGQAGATSRSINFLFFRPIFDFGNPEGFHFYVAPKAYVYVADLSNNPDISKYRGYCDLRTAIGWRQGLELSFLGRIGSNYNRGSVQFDLTYPIRDLLAQNLDVFIDAQYFNGYGESLLSYNRRTNAFRIGLGLAR